MGTLDSLAGSVIGALVVLIIYGCILAIALFPALGIYRAGTGFYHKIKNETRMSIYNKAYDAYRPYSNLIFTYINLINSDNNFNKIILNTKRHTKSYVMLLEKQFFLPTILYVYNLAALLITLLVYLTKKKHLKIWKRSKKNF